MKNMLALSVELQASGRDETQHLSRTLRPGETVRLGRAAEAGLSISWDPKVSREQADLTWDGERLRVTCVPTARNRIRFQNAEHREITLTPGEVFQIGSTRFYLQDPTDPTARDTVDASIFDTSSSLNTLERSFSLEELTHVSFGDPEEQMELLARLPDLIASAESDETLALQLAGMLLEAIPQAEGVAVAQFDLTRLEQQQECHPIMLRVETRPGFEGRFRPSRGLILRALQQQESVIHIWAGGADEERFTISEGLGWAFCSPIRGESGSGWCLYVAGKGARHGGVLVTDDALKGDLRFTQLVAQLLGAVRQVRLLQEHKTQLSTFFSPTVIEHLTSAKADQALTPAERNISVLFCDVRGFSRKAELMSDNLQLLLHCVSEALGAMANGILDWDGTIADFQGDAALGFWGWPVELAEGPLPACRAALDIERSFRIGAQLDDSRLEGFSVGIGLVHGRAIAGQIGTTKQAKVGVFGPVVNQGARLESLTKQFGTSICIDATTADWVRRLLPADEGRLRRLAPVYPYGMRQPLEVFGLLPPEGEFPEVSNAMIAAYEVALDAAIAASKATS